MNPRIFLSVVVLLLTAAGLVVWFNWSNDSSIAGASPQPPVSAQAPLAAPTATPSTGLVTPQGSSLPPPTAATTDSPWFTFTQIPITSEVLTQQPGSVAAYKTILNSSDFLSTLSKNKPFRITFPAPTGTVTFTPARAPRPGSLVGELSGEPSAQFQIVHHRGATYLNLSRYEKNEHWILSIPAEDSKLGTSGTLFRIDPALMPENCAACAAGLSHPHHDDSHVEANPESVSANEETDLIQADEETAPIQGDPQPELITGSDRETPYLVDLFVGYSIKARQNAGGVPSIEAQIIAAVDRINQAFINSNVTNLEVALIGMMEDPSWADPGSGNMTTELTINLDNDSASNPTFNTVTDAAKAAGADRVLFMVNDVISGNAGLAYTPGIYGIVARTYVNAANLTLEHEFGHTLTARHQITDESNKDKTRWYYGWVLKGSNGATYRSILATPTGNTRIPYYSNPDILFLGSRTGATNGYNATGDPTVGQASLVSGYYDGTNPGLGANNARAFREYAPSAETPRSRPGTFTASINGTAFNPSGTEAQRTYTIPEGGTLEFSVVFSSAIVHDTRVIVLPRSATAPVIDPDITRTTGTLTFTPANWHIPQTLTFSAAEDLDSSNGTSVITIKAQGHTGSRLNVTLAEIDNDTNSAPALTRLQPTTTGVRLASGTSLPLAFSATDDANPLPTLTYTWSQLSGPVGGITTFSAPSAPATNATFSANGNYLLRGSAFDGEFTSHLDVWVTVGDTSTTDLGVTQETNQGIVIEAEDFTAYTAGSTGRTWTAATSVPGAFAGGIVRATPATGTNLGDSATNGPRLDYSFRGVTTPQINSGLFAIRARSTTGATAKVNVGINGNQKSLITLDASGTWAWFTGYDYSLTDYTGLRTLNIWQNSPGIEIDRVALIPFGSPLITTINNKEEPGLALRTDSVPPVFLSTPPVTATAGQAYTYSATGQSPLVTASTLRFSIAPGAPSWLTLADHLNGTASLSGTPAPSDQGTSTVAILLTDGTTTTRQSWSLTTFGPSGNTAPTFTSSPSTALTAGAAYSYAITTSDPDGQAVTLTAPSLPAWLTFIDHGNGTATLSGTVPTSPSPAYPVSLAVTDGFLTTTQDFTLTAPQLPGITLASPANTSAALASGHGLLLDATLTGEGTLSATWSATGPGTVTFADPTSPTTTATFSTNGTYTLTLTASSSLGGTPATQTLTVYIGQPSTTNLLLHLPFDEGSGSTTADAGPSAQPVTKASDVSWTTGQRNAALQFGASNTATVETTNNFSLAPANAYTAAAWIYPTQLHPTDGSSYGIFQQLDGTGTGRSWLSFLNRNGTGKLYSFIGNTGTEPETALPLNTWSHIAVTYSAATVKLYLNGTEIASASRTLEANTARLRLGQNKSANAPFPGKIDDFRLYQRALSPAELTQLATENLAPSLTFGPAPAATAGQPANLTATITDDEQPTPAALTTTWTLLTGPGTATFANAAALNTTVTLSAPGAYTLRLFATDTHTTTFLDLPITATAAPTFAAWLSTAHPSLTGPDALPTADPDADGVPNLIEYALGSTPDSAASRPLLEYQISNQQLQFTFTPKVLTGLTYIIQSSSDLTTWTDTTLTSLLTVGAPYTYIDSVTISPTNPKRFLRLRVSE